MEYNKQQFTKTKDKKVLHKVKKQWVVVSLAMLAMLGGDAMAKKVSAHADVNSDNNTNNGAVTLKDRLNQSLSQAHKVTLQTPANSNDRQNNQNNANDNNSQRNINVNQISQQANVLHKRIIRNANFANANQSTDAVHSENGRNGQQQIRVANQKGTSQKENVSMPRLSSPNDSGDTLPYGNPISADEYNMDFDEVDTSGQSSKSPKSNPLNELNWLIGRAQHNGLLKSDSYTQQIHIKNGVNQSYSYRYRCIPESSSNGLGNIIIFEGGTLPTMGNNNLSQNTTYNNLFPSIDNNDPWHIYFDPNYPTFPVTSDIASGKDSLWFSSSDKLTNTKPNDSDNGSDRLEKYLPNEYSDLQNESGSSHALPNQSDTNFEPLNNNEESRPVPHTAINNSDNVSDNTDYTAPFAAYSDAHNRYEKSRNQYNTLPLITKPKSQEVKSANLSGLHMSYMYALFQDDPYLESINLKGFNGSEVLNMNAMVNDCPNLSYINLEGLNLSHVRDMRDVFASDKSLKTLDLANVVTSPYVFSYNNTFKSDTNLSSVNLSGIKTITFYHSDFAYKSTHFKQFLNDQIMAKTFNHPLPDPHSYGIKRMVSDMSDLFYDDPLIQRLRLSSDTIFAARTANQNPANNWGLFGTSNMVADYSGHQINHNNQTLYDEFHSFGPTDVSPISKGRGEAIFNLIFPSYDENAQIPNTNDYEYFAATDLPLDYKINSDASKSDASDLIYSGHMIDGAIDGQGHQYANGINYNGNRSDGFETYQGALGVPISKNNKISIKPQDPDVSGQFISKPNGYSDSHSQQTGNGSNLYEVNDYGIIDKLHGKPEKYKIYFYSDNDPSKTPISDSIIPIYSGTTQVGKQFNIKNKISALDTYLSRFGYKVYSSNFYDPPFKITTDLSHDYPTYLNGDSTNDYNSFINGTDNGYLSEYNSSGDRNAWRFKVPVKKTIPTGYLNVPIEYYNYYDNSNVKYYSDIHPSSDLSGKYGTYADGLLQHVNSFMPKYYHIINSDVIPGYHFISSDNVKNVLNHYTVGTALTGYGVSGGAYNGSTQSIDPIRIPVSPFAKMSIKYINELNPVQSKITSSHEYNAATFAPNMKEHVAGLAQEDSSSINEFYIDSSNIHNYSKDSNPNLKNTFDVYVLPHVYQIPVQLTYNNRNEGASFNVGVSDPQGYGQSSDGNLINAINGHLNGSKFLLSSSSQNGLSNYLTGEYINSDNVTGGGLNGYDLANNKAGNVNTLVVPIGKVTPKFDKIEYKNELYGSSYENNPRLYWPGKSTSSWSTSQNVDPNGDIVSEAQNDLGAAGIPSNNGDDSYYIDPNDENYQSDNGIITVNILPRYVDAEVRYKNISDNTMFNSGIHNGAVEFPTSYYNASHSLVYGQLPSAISVTNNYLETNQKDKEVFSENNQGFPIGYQTYPQNQYEFPIKNDGSTIVPVAKQHVVAEGDWDLDHPNDSALFKVLSDGSGDPHNDTLVMYSNGSNKVMHTSSWSKAGNSYNHWVFPSDGSDTRPNALNRDSIAKVEFQGNVQLPSDNASSSNPAYSGLFQNMHYLTAVDFTNNTPDAASTTDMSSMFSDDPRLTSLDLSKLNVGRLSDASNMFAGDSKLSDLTLSATKTNNLHHMSGMFTSDTSLKGTTFQDKDVDNDTSQGTNSIKNISDINTSNVSDMSDVFESDTNLSNLDLSSWHTDNVSDMDAMFANDPNLQHLNIQNMTTKGMYVGASDQMFQGDFSDSNTNYSDNPNANPKPKDYAIVMSNQMCLTSGSGLIGYWASPDYKTDPVMFSPRELDQYGANLGYLPSATWIKQANNPNDLTAETFQYYNQMNSLVGSAKTSIPKDYTVTVSPYEFIKHDTPSGYQLPPSNSSLTDTLLNSSISNPAFTSFSNVDQRVNVLGDVEKSAMPVNVTESGESSFSNVTKRVNIWGYYGDFKDSLDGENKWYKNASGGNGPDSYYSLSSSSNDSGHKMYYTLSSGNYSSGTNYNNYSEKTNIQWQNNTSSAASQEPVLNYADMVANDVKIQFIDQNGNTVHTDGPLSNVHIGQVIDLPHAHDSFRTPTSDAYHNYGLPAGYTMDSDQPTSYKIQNNDSTVNLYVTGAKETATAEVNLVYEDSDGNNVSDITSYPVQLSGHVDNVVNFNPLTITPKTGYQLDTDKTNSFNNVDGSFPARLDKYNSSNWVDPRNPSNNNYHYPDVKMQDNTSITNGEPTVFFKDVQAVLTTVYINQSGNVVGSPDTIEGTAGNSVNVTDPKENGEAIPQGYTLVGGDNKPAGQNSDVIGKNQDTQYTLNAGHHTVYLHVNGESDNDAHVRVLCILHNRDHSTSVQSDNDYDLKNNTDNGKVHIGDVINVNPSDPINKDTNLSSYLKDNHYDIAPSDQSQPVTVIGKNQVSPQTVIFNYDQNDMQSESITYHFYDQETNQEVSSGVGTGSIGTTYSLNDKVPNGYHLADSLASYNYKFSNVPQDVWIPVVGNSVNDTFTIYQIEKHLDGSRTVNPISIPVSYDIGQSFHVSPYGFSYQDGTSTESYSVPSDYHADPSDQDVDVQVKSNGQLSRSSVAYGYSQDYQPNAIGDIKIHYVTSAGKPSNNDQEIDEVSDHGLVGDNFILRPYYDDLPDTIADGYQSTGQVYGDNGSLSPSILNGSLDDGNYNFNNGVTKFRSGSTPNIYIQVEKING